MPPGDRIAFYHDGSERGLLVVSDAGEQLNLYRHDFGGETVQLTAYENPVLAAQWSSDGEQVAYVADADREEPIDGHADVRRLDAGADGFETTVHDWLGDTLLVSDNSRDTTRVGATTSLPTT